MIEHFNGKLEPYRNRYIEAVLNGEHQAAADVVRDALKLTSSPISIYLEILGPSQVSVGESWLEGSINIAQEHLATQLTLQQMDFLRRSLEPRSRNGFRAIITSVEGDLHGMGARFIADFFHFDGWDVDFLGSNTPTQDLVEYARKRKADLVALSVTLPGNLAKLEDCVPALRQLPTEPKILIGGHATQLPAFEKVQEKLNLEGVAKDAIEAIQIARDLMGLNGTSKSLDSFLQEIGSRIQSIRKSKSWSQQQLGDAAELDRTYISALEHGKQNLTLGALKRVSDALDVPIEDLIADRGF